MRVPTALPLTLLVLLAVSLGVGIAATPVAAQDSPDEFDGHERVVIVELTDDGDAEWRIIDYYYLEDDADVDRFEAFAEEVRSGQRSGGYDRGTFEAMIPHAEERTDREMSIEDAGWSATDVEPVEASPAFEGEELDGGSVGSLSYSVTWTNFADTSDDRLSLQDAFLTEGGGTWWRSIFAHERFVVEAPPGHAFVTAPHAINDGTLAWDGPHEFDANDFDIVLEDRSTLVGSLLGSWLGLLGVFVVLAGVVAGVWYLQRRGDGLPPLPGSGGGTDREPTVDAAAGADSDAEGADADEGTLAYEEDVDDDVDVELLSDEERVHRLLRQNGGRMKQASIVKSTGWSNAKVSQLLSQMDEDDEIEKLRIGRENLITLPEVDPTQVD